MVRVGELFEQVEKGTFNRAAVEECFRFFYIVLEGRGVEQWGPDEQGAMDFENFKVRVLTSLMAVDAMYRRHVAAAQDR